MALTTAELQQCKFWLGYGNLLASARPYFDIALVFEDVVLANLDTTWAEGYVRTTLLANLTALDTQIQSQVVLQAQATELVGEVKLDARAAMNVLLDLQDSWIDKLSFVLKIPRAPKPGGSSQIEVT